MPGVGFTRDSPDGVPSQDAIVLPFGVFDKAKRSRKAPRFSPRRSEPAPIGRRQIKTNDIADLVDEQQIDGKPECRCGCRPNAFQILRIVVCEKPVSAAMDRIDQCVASFGVDRRARSLTAATRSSSIVRGLPGRASSNSPSMRSFRERRRHLPSVLMNAQLSRNGFAGDAVRTSEDDSAAFRQRPRNTRDHIMK